MRTLMQNERLGAYYKYKDQSSLKDQTTQTKKGCFGSIAINWGFNIYKKSCDWWLQEVNNNFNLQLYVIAEQRGKGVYKRMFQEMER